MKSHTGESPVKIIDQSFADIIKSPSSFINAGQNTRNPKMSYSQSPKGTRESKTSTLTSKRMRGVSVSPDYDQASKKTARKLGTRIQYK